MSHLRVIRQTNNLVWCFLSSDRRHIKDTNSHTSEKYAYLALSGSHRRHKGSSKRESKPVDANGMRLTTMPEEEEEDSGITIQVGGQHLPTEGQLPSGTRSLPLPAALALTYYYSLSLSLSFCCGA